MIHEVEPAVLSELHQQLNKMRACRGENCNYYYGKKYTTTTSTPLTTPQTTSAWTQTVANTSGITDKEPTVISTENAVTLATAPSSYPDRLSSPLPTESRSEGVASTPESSVDSSETTESSEVLSFTTVTPTVGSIQPENLTTKPLEKKTSRRGNEKTSEENSGEEVTQESLKKSKQYKKKITTEESVMSPTNSVQNGSEGLGNTSESVVNTTKTTVDASAAMETSTFTTSAPTKANAKTEQLTMKPIKRKTSKRRKGKNSHEKGVREAESKGGKAKKNLKKFKKSKKKSPKTSLPLPTESMVPGKPLTTPRDIPYPFSISAKSEKPEKPTRSALTFTNGSEEGPTVFVNASEPEPSSLETRLSTTVPKSWTAVSREENTSDMKLREYSTVKPTRRKSTKRRKNGEKEGKGPSKKSKKLKKGKKKSSGKGVLLTPSNTGSSAENEEISKPSENQTRNETNSEPEKPKLGEHEDSKENQESTEISRKRNRKPSGKRQNRNSKKRSKKPTKRPQASQISEGGVDEDETVSPEGGGSEFEQELSPLDP